MRDSVLVEPDIGGHMANLHVRSQAGREGQRPHETGLPVRDSCTTQGVPGSARKEGVALVGRACAGVSKQ